MNALLLLLLHGTLHQDQSTSHSLKLELTAIIVGLFLTFGREHTRIVYVLTSSTFYIIL